MKQQENPLKGLSVPSVGEMADYILNQCGIATIDLANAEQRQRFRKLLVSLIGRVLRWELQDPLEKAACKAVAHVLSLMEDPNYQEHRKQRRVASLERRRERDAERKREHKLEAESRRQQRKGLVQ